MAREMDKGPVPTAAGDKGPRLAWLPLPLLAVAVAVLYRLDIGVILESTVLLATLNTLFCASVSLFITFLAARSYLEAGSRALLPLGCGALAFGLTYLAAGLLMARPNMAITVHNTGTCLAGAFYLLSAGWALTPQRGEPAPVLAPRALGPFFIGIFAAMSLMIWASLARVLPAFYLVGQGFTTLRQTVLVVTVAEFALASLCFGILYTRSRSLFQLWYCLGLALIGLGIGMVIIEGAPATPISWVGRSAQYLGGLYMLIAVSTLAQGSRGWKIPLEQALQESKERYRTLVDLAPDAVLVHQDGRIVYCNHAALQLYKAVTPRQLLGRRCLGLIHPDEREVVRTRIQAVLAGGVTPLREFRHLRLDGSEVPVETAAAPITWDGKPAVQVIIRSIAERKQVEQVLQEKRGELTAVNEDLRAEQEELIRVNEELQAQKEELATAYKELREADRHKNEFMAILSHELRNPLASIQNSLHILDRAAPGGDQAKRAKAVIDRQTGQLTHLVDDLLDVTRITQNKIKLQRERLELNELVRRALDDYRALFEQHQVGLEAILWPDPLFVNADGARLAQVIGNLLQNAVKFTHRDGRVTVSVAGDPGGRAVIRVTDTGVGMPPEVLPRLFQPFMQVETTLDRSRGGLGLGLALSKGLIELHGGEISAHSAGLNRGSEFTVSLPLDDTSVQEPRVLQAKAPRRSRRVLIIEDNVDLAESLRELLEFDGHKVMIANSGAEGLAKACEQVPEILLCDIGLPGMDGYAVARSFRADEVLARVFLVALTGYALPEDLERAAEAGFDRHLAKPPDLEALERMLAEVPGGGSMAERSGVSLRLMERVKRKGGKIH